MSQGGPPPPPLPAGYGRQTDYNAWRPPGPPLNPYHFRPGTSGPHQQLQPDMNTLNDYYGARPSLSAPLPAPDPYGRPSAAHFPWGPPVLNQQDEWSQTAPRRESPPRERLTPIAATSYGHDYSSYGSEPSRWNAWQPPDIYSFQFRAGDGAAAAPPSRPPPANPDMASLAPPAQPVPWEEWWRRHQAQQRGPPQGQERPRPTGMPRHNPLSFVPLKAPPRPLGPFVPEPSTSGNGTYQSKETLQAQIEPRQPTRGAPQGWYTDATTSSLRREAIEDPGYYPPAKRRSLPKLDLPSGNASPPSAGLGVTLRAAEPMSERHGDVPDFEYKFIHRTPAPRQRRHRRGNSIAVKDSKRREEKNRRDEFREQLNSLSTVVPGVQGVDTRKEILSYAREYIEYLQWREKKLRSIWLERQLDDMKEERATPELQAKLLKELESKLDGGPIRSVDRFGDDQGSSGDDDEDEDNLRSATSSVTSAAAAIAGFRDLSGSAETNETVETTVGEPAPGIEQEADRTAKLETRPEMESSDNV